MQRLRTQDLMTARICAVLANVNRAKETDKIWTAADFALLPAAPGPAGTVSVSSAAPPAVWDEKRQLEMIERLNRAFGGRDLRGLHRAN